MSLAHYTDVNECEEESSNDCEQICTNIEGGFKCSCTEGLFLAADWISCTSKIISNIFHIVHSLQVSIDAIL